MKRAFLLWALVVGCDSPASKPSVEPRPMKPPSAFGLSDDMLAIPAGPFIGRAPKCMEGRIPSTRDDDENALAMAHQNVQAFLIDRRVATCAEFAKCVEGGGCTKSRSYCLIEGVIAPLTSAHEYCAWRGKRLIRYLEWQRAARSTDGRFFPAGGDTWDLNTCRKKPRPCTQTSPEGLEYLVEGPDEWTSDTDCKSVDGELVTGPVRIKSSALLTEIRVDRPDADDVLIRCAR